MHIRCSNATAPINNYTFTIKFQFKYLQPVKHSVSCWEELLVSDAETDPGRKQLLPSVILGIGKLFSIFRSIMFFFMDPVFPSRGISCSPRIDLVSLRGLWQCRSSLYCFSELKMVSWCLSNLDENMCRNLRLCLLVVSVCEFAILYENCVTVN